MDFEIKQEGTGDDFRYVVYFGGEYLFRCNREQMARLTVLLLQLRDF